MRPLVAFVLFMLSIECLAAPDEEPIECSEEASTKIKLADEKEYAICGNADSADGKAKLFIVSENPADSLLIDTNVGSDCNGNGLSSPEIADLDGDGIVDWVYAGDLYGNLWTFDLTAFNGKAFSDPPHRLFQSCATDMWPIECSPESRQPITVKPALARNTKIAGDKSHPNLNVFWGTGALCGKQDTSEQTFYSVLHTGNAEPRYHTDLVKQKFSNMGTAGDARTVSGRRVDYLGEDGGGAEYGWYLPLPDSGERLINNPALRGDLVVFNSTVPAEGGLCGAGAEGWHNAVSQMDGLTPMRAGSDSNNRVFDYTQDGSVDASDDIDGDIALALKVKGAPTAPQFDGDYQLVVNAGVENKILMNFGPKQWVGRSGWYQLR